MRTASFPYAALAITPSTPYPNGQSIYRPWVIATLAAANGQSLSCVTLLDTGADACIFPLAIAVALKLDVLALPTNLTGGVGTSSNLTYYDTLSIDLGQGVQFSAYVGFTEGMNAQGIGLLGQDGFFSGFDVHFSHRSKLCTVYLP